MFKWLKNNPIRSMFLIPILLVATISIFHVVTWYNLSNPLNWAIFLSVAIEIGAITALIAVTNKIKGGVWFMFILVTIIQMIGNIFYSYKEIDENGELFKSWVELTYPIWEFMGTDSGDVVGLKRWLSFLTGGLLPIISLTSLHFFVKYEKPNQSKQIDSSQINVDEIRGVMDQLIKKGKISKYSDVTEDEVTYLANSQHRNENFSGDTQTKIKKQKLDANQKVLDKPKQKVSKTWKNIMSIRNKKNNNNIGRMNDGD